MKKLLWFFLLFWGTAPLFAQDPDIEDNERSTIEAIFRTSDDPDEIPTSVRGRGRKRVSVPKDAIRVGCMCMDSTLSKTHSSGSCSGHGGVRFWYYRTVAGDTVSIVTGRHERHPHPLTVAEKSEMIQPKPKALHPAALTTAGGVPIIVMQPAPALPYNYPFQNDDDDDRRISWSETVAVGFAGIALYASLRFLLGWLERNSTLTRYALRHLLRYRERSTPHKDQQDPPATRD